VASKHVVFQELIQKAGLKPEEVLIIGDKTWDVEAASLVGAPVMLMAKTLVDYKQFLTVQAADIIVYHDWSLIERSIRRILGWETLADHSVSRSLPMAA
jgi:phosphoglycolate phosphatase-like HAD superfamily hydrolase